MPLGVADSNNTNFVTIENQVFILIKVKLLAEELDSQLDPYLTTFSDIFEIGCIISGCTDPFSDNFNEMAIVNDGSCQQYEIGCMDSLAKF